jgi:hypothetical protein
MNTRRDKHWHQRQTSSETIGQPSWFWPKPKFGAKHSKKPADTPEPCVSPSADTRFHRIIAPPALERHPAMTNREVNHET